MAKIKNTSAKKNTQVIVKREKLRRTNSHQFLLNDKEEKALNRYLEKYRIANKSKFIRETLMLRVLRQFEEDHPTLF
ncbi:MAG: hypothetical protein LBV75_02865 [Paludibacter sp.]|jgi:hypothetical protein|nr:hypothetical protein [Paludibacter sp.]